MLPLRGAVVALAAALVAPAALALNRCTDAAGKVSYSDKPCQSGEQRTSVQIVDSKGFAPPPPPQPKPARSEPRAAGAPAPTGGVTVIGGDPRCARAKREYENMSAATVGRAPSVADFYNARKAARSACGEVIDMSRDEGEIIAREQSDRANRISADRALRADEQRREDDKRVHDRECLFAPRGGSDDKGKSCD